MLFRRRSVRRFDMFAGERSRERWIFLACNDLMGVGGEILPEEYQELMDHHMGSRMRKALDMRLIEN